MTYEQLLEERGFTILAWEMFSQWQGDYATIVEKEGKIGFTVIGYGSCEGCDALYACDTPEETESLIQGVIADISWGTVEELTEEIVNTDGKLNRWYHNDAGFKESIDTLLQALNGRTNKEEIK